MDAYILDAVRSPMGRAHKGSLADVRPDELAGRLVASLLARHPELDPARIDDVIGATAMPEAEQGMNLGRIVAQRAGLADSVPGMTLNRFCASGLEAGALAAAKIHSGMAELVLAFGVESMSRIPMGGHDFSPNPWLAENRPGNYLGMGLTAENLVDQYKISREEQDAFALQSHQRALAAEAAGMWNDERIPYEVDGTLVLDHDEGPRADTTLEALGALRPSFRQDGTVTPGNSSPLTDGAAALLVVSEAVLKELGVEPLGRLRAYAVAGVDPARMGLGPVQAVPKVLAKAGWKLDEIEHIELNEAFSAQSLAVIRELGLDPAKTNPQGGAIALGHPLGMSGARLVGTLLHAMKRGGLKRGLATLCVGGGMGAAALFERE
jgi:acetyl-CoA acyltransferase